MTVNQALEYIEARSHFWHQAIDELVSEADADLIAALETIEQDEHWFVHHLREAFNADSTNQAV